MMNLVDLQDKLKNLSQDQLVQQMQAPTGDIPQFLLLSEITRRQKMRTAYEGQTGQDETTVAQDMIAAGGMPAEFAGQMAGAMAPQTDVMANDAAMPQQEMMPQPVQGMAEGGIVALREGGSVQNPPQAPRTFVRNGMIYVVNERGEEVPWAPVSQVEGMDMPSPEFYSIEGGNIGAGQFSPDRFPTMPEPYAPALTGGVDGAPVISAVPGAQLPGALPPMAAIFDAENQRRGVNPSFSEFDGIGTLPEGAAALPRTGYAQPLSVGRPPVEPERAQQAAENLFNVIGGAITPPLQALDQSAVGQYRTPSLTSLLPQFMQDRIAAADVGGMPLDFGAAGEGFPVPDSISGAPAVPGQFQGPPMAPPTRDPAQAELDALIAGAPPTEGARPLDRLFSGVASGARAVVDNFRAPEGGYDFDPNLGYMMGAEDPEVVAAAEAAAAEEAAARTAAGDPTSPTAPSGGVPGPSGGGIASVAAGAAGVAPSSFEQELLDMLASREKRAQQDKWLALAQFGLQLMSSKEPTFGGAIGEAGAPALDALRSSRESYEGDRLGLLSMLEQHRAGQAQLALQQQAAAARSAAGSGGAGTPFGELSAGQGRLLGQYDSEINRLSEVLSGATPGVTEAQRLDAAQRIEALSRERAQIVSGLSGVPFGAGGSSGATMFDVR
jgi:hypothetical protein